MISNQINLQGSEHFPLLHYNVDVNEFLVIICHNENIEDGRKYRSVSRIVEIRLTDASQTVGNDTSGRS